MKKLLMFVLVSPLLFACNSKVDSMEKWKNEIIETERSFSALAQEEGIAKAFLAYAAEDAVLMRNNNLIIGKEAMRESFQAAATENGTLAWTADFADVASSGDLGYTYGKYIYTSTDSLGNEQSVEGVFHTVWKRQADGKWKFVWD